MLIVQNTATPAFNVTGVGMAQYYYIKSGSGVAIAGGGTVTGVAFNTFRIVLAAGESNTLGDLCILCLTGAGALVATVNHQVVEELPGKLTPAQRVLIALDVLGASDTVELGWSLADAIKVIAAEAAGRSSVVGSTVKFRNLGNTLDRITALVDTATGQRLTVTYDLS